LTTAKRFLTDLVTLIRLAPFQATAPAGANRPAAPLRTACSCSLGQITHTLYKVGGEDRRSM
jgi:hypothetical protein